MGVEKKFVRIGLEKAQMAEYFSKQLERAGYGGMDLNRTPMGTQITIFAEKPGIIIGKGGKTIHKLTRDLESIFHLDNPQIDVQEVKVPELNAQMMASRLAGAIERGLYFRKAGHNMLRRIMDAGALGCEIDIAGKLTGPRNRTQKFVDGNMLHAGNPADQLVDYGFAVAVKKLGVIGCRVRIVPPTIKLPGRFKVVGEEAGGEVVETKQAGMEEIVETAPREEPQEVMPEQPVPVEAEPEVEVTEQPEVAEAPAEPVPAEQPEVTPEAEPENVITAEQENEKGETTEPEEVQSNPDTGEVEERMQDGVLEHKHEEYNYWHPASRIHKKEVN